MPVAPAALLNESVEVKLFYYKGFVRNFENSGKLNEANMQYPEIIAILRKEEIEKPDSLKLISSLQDWAQLKIKIEDFQDAETKLIEARHIISKKEHSSQIDALIERNK